MIVARAVLLLGDRLLGWYLIDEPELPSHRRWRYATPLNMANLRQRIRQIESGLGTWHRPCIITFTELFRIQKHTEDPLIENNCFPVEYARQGAIDMAWLDRYPWRLSKVQLEAQLPLHLHSYIEESLTGNTPVTTARTLRELRNDINEGRIPGDPGYIHVLCWAQTHGWPWRPNPLHPPAPSSAMEPQRPPMDFDEVSKKIPFQRYLRRPDFNPVLPVQAALIYPPTEARFEAWITFVEASEGIAYFTQPQVSDDLIVRQHVPIVEELAYFERLRTQARQWPYGDNLHRLVLDWWQSLHPYSGPVSKDEELRTLIRILRYWYPPSGAEQEVWMLLINRRSSYLRFEMMVKSQYSAAWRLQEMKFMQPVGSPVRLIGKNPYSGQSDPAYPVVIEVPHHQMRLFKVVPATP